MSVVPREDLRGTTYTAVLCGVKMSLTVPPETLKNAELQKPVRNRKMRKTAVDVLRQL